MPGTSCFWMMGVSSAETFFDFGVAAWAVTGMRQPTARAIAITNFIILQWLNGLPSREAPLDRDRPPESSGACVGVRVHLRAIEQPINRQMPFHCRAI